MINLKAFREYVVGLSDTVNNSCQYKIDNVQMAVSEAHMIKKLQSSCGITLCASFPDSRGTGSADSMKEDEQAFFFVVEKVSPGTDNNDGEINRYEKLQTVALALRDALLQSSSDCFRLIPDYDYKIEWEWQIFGGYNGLSIGVKFENYD